jgi:hypothetical protein
MDGGQTMLKSDREINGTTQLSLAYNSHTNPDAYSESLIERCKSRSYTHKEQAMSPSEIQKRISQHRSVLSSIPKGSKPDFSAPVTNNSMIHEEEPPSAPLIINEASLVATRLPSSQPRTVFPPQQYQPQLQPQFPQQFQPQFQSPNQQLQPQQLQPQQLQPQPIQSPQPLPEQKHKHKKPPIYNRSSLTTSKTSEIAELKRLVRKQEEQIALLLSAKK